MSRKEESKNDKFLRIYEQNKEPVLRTCYMFLKDCQLAEDAAQEVFYRVYCKLHTFSGRSDIKTWITAIAVNICKDKLRKKSHGEVPKDDISFNGSEFDESKTENRLILVGAITDLPIELREVVILFYYRELKQNEIAKILKIPLTTVAYRLKKAKEILRKNIKEDIFYE